MRNEHEHASIPTDVERSPAPASTPSGESTHQSGTEAAAAPAVVEEVLIEEVSIDGMCGVY
jgi:mycofactocin precursor